MFRIPSRYLKQRTVGSISDSDTMAQGGLSERILFLCELKKRTGETLRVLGKA
jgi:hypothetical protein